QATRVRAMGRASRDRRRPGGRAIGRSMAQGPEMPAGRRAGRAAGAAERSPRPAGSSTAVPGQGKLPGAGPGPAQKRHRSTEGMRGAMDLLIVLRDALATFVGGLATALEARAAGQEVGVLFTQEALAALARGALRWPRELEGQAARWLLADRGAGAGLSVLGRGGGRRGGARGRVARRGA